MMNIWLMLHVLGAILLLGNIITAAFWKVRADLGKDPAAIHQAAKNVMLADMIFTLPGIVLIIVTGNVMAVQAGYSMNGLNWLTMSLFLFGLTGAIWLALLLPLQQTMIRLSAEGVKSGVMPRAYTKVSAYWAVFGTLATLLPVAVLYLMISKGF